MSAEHFDTVLTADMRTATDGRSCDIAPAMSQSPRWLSPDGTINRSERTWVCCHLYAEDVVRIAADAVLNQPMTGISGDHPGKRLRLAAILGQTADLIRQLALDDAYDGQLDAERWNDGLARLGALAVVDDEKIVPPTLRHTLVGWAP